MTVVRKRLRKPSSRTFAVDRTGSVDLWLSRLSHIAQFGLFAFTLAFSYFTVLPIYQKSVLEESLAKRELQLAKINEQLAKSYKRVRSFAMTEFHIDVLPKCTAIFISSVPKSKEAKSRTEHAFEIDVSACFHKVAREAEYLKDLSEGDRQTFDAFLSGVANELEVERASAIEKYQKAEFHLTDDFWSTLPRDSYQVVAQENVEKWLNAGIPDEKKRRSIALHMTKEAIRGNYETFIIEKVKSFATIDWEGKRSQ